MTRGLPGHPARLLSVFTGGYRGLLGTRDWLYTRGVLKSRALPCPVVSVGNLTVGGTGKTPAVELAVETLLSLGYRPAIVSRGYGRRTSGVQVVADAASIRLDAEDGGDEPFLLARRLPGVPVVVGSNRYDAARHAVERFGVTAIVMDDGFQHRTLKKDLEIVMARASDPWGNGRLLPAGPLREPLDALRRADLIVVTGASSAADTEPVAETARVHGSHVPVLSARYATTGCWEAGSMHTVPLDHLAAVRLLAFAGIGSPVGFERTLKENRLTIEDTKIFPDHFWYSRGDLARLSGEAARLGASGLVTTEKDWVRLRRIEPGPLPVYVLSVRLVLVEGEAAWRAAFERTCSGA